MADAEEMGSGEPERSGENLEKFWKNAIKL